jgi:hypothetical protein
MPLLFPKDPPDGSSIVERTVKATGLGTPGSVFAGDSPGDYAVLPAHRVYSVDCADIAEGILLETAVAGHWRYLLLRDSLVSHEVHIASNPDTGESQFAALYHAPLSHAFLETFALVEADEQIKTGYFEIRLLTCRPLALSAVWLHGPKDLIVPIEFAPDGRPLKLYAPEDILPLLKSQAILTLQQAGRLNTV